MNTEKTRFDPKLSDFIPHEPVVPMELANRVFAFFRDCPLFNWKQANNDCEDRANAACLLLWQWNIPCVKAWVFSGGFLHRDEGSLANKWNYHVAAALPVQKDDALSIYVIDPATLKEPDTIANWAEGITETAFSHHLVKQWEHYIFNPVSIAKDNWHSQNSQNYKWTIQGLAGINGVTKTGKAQLVFNKRKIAVTEEKFRQLLQHKPAELLPI